MFPIFQDYDIQFVLNTTVPSQKLNFGLSFYGRSYNLSDPTQTQIGAAVNGPGAAEQYTKEEGFMAYYEVQYEEKLKDTKRFESYLKRKHSL